MEVGTAVDATVLAWATGIATAADKSELLPGKYTITLRDLRSFVHVSMIPDEALGILKIEAVAAFRGEVYGFDRAIYDRYDLGAHRPHDVHRVVLEFLRAARSSEAAAPLDLDGTRLT